MPKKQKSKPKATEDRYVRYVNRLCEYFRRAVFAGEYTLGVEVDCLPGPEIPAGKEVMAIIDIDTTYLSIHMKLFKGLREWFNEKKFQQIAGVICHEFCHVLTEPLYELAVVNAAPSQLKEIETVRERQTERVSASLFQLVPKGVWQQRVGRVGK